MCFASRVYLGFVVPPSWLSLRCIGTCLWSFLREQIGIGALSLWTCVWEGEFLSLVQSVWLPCQFRQWFFSLFSYTDDER
jgi:hypothetical protein